MVLFGRCVPLIRSVVSIPAGIDRMPLPRFLLLTAIGSGVWNAIFIGLGWILGDNWGRRAGLARPGQLRRARARRRRADLARGPQGAPAVGAVGQRVGAGAHRR